MHTHYYMYTEGIARVNGVSTRVSRSFLVSPVQTRLK